MWWRWEKLGLFFILLSRHKDNVLGSRIPLSIIKTSSLKSPLFLNLPFLTKLLEIKSFQKNQNYFLNLEKSKTSPEPLLPVLKKELNMTNLSFFFILVGKDMFILYFIIWLRSNSLSERNLKESNWDQNYP